MCRIDGCEEVTNNSKIPLEENRSKMTFLNRLKRLIRIVRVDNGVIKNGKRCDYLVIDDSDQHYVELKGSAISDGFEQLKSSMNQLGTANHKFCYIIYSSSNSICPALTTTVQKEKKIFKQSYKAKLEIKRSGYTQSLPAEWN